MKELKDIMALIPTPLTDNGEVDEASLKRLIDFEMENGCYGVGVLAAIGEGYLFSRVLRGLELGRGNALHHAAITLSAKRRFGTVRC